MTPRELSHARERETGPAAPDAVTTADSTFTPRWGFPC
jgi:hypothetical protein